MFKRNIAIVFTLLFIICISSSASAATQDTWGPQWYTPCDANVKAGPLFFKGTSL